MLKSRVKTTYNGKEIEKIFVSGNIIKAEMKNNMLFINLSSYRGKNNDSEFTNNIAVNDPKRIEVLKKLNKGTQIFCEINVQKKEYNGKVYDNLYLFNFEIGKPGNGEVLIAETNDSIDPVNFF